jgi:hypothetical protein
MMAMMTLSEKDFQRGQKYVNSLNTLAALDDYMETLKSYGYGPEDFERLMGLVNDRRTQLAPGEAAFTEANKARFASYSYNLARLDPFKSTPRSADTDFFKDCAGRPPLIGNKNKWRERYTNAPLVYAAVVQANTALYEPGNDYLPAVFVIATDDAHRYDTEYLSELANKIYGLKNSADVPNDCRNLIATLRDDQSVFCWKIGTSIAGNADTWCFTHNMEQKYLPHQCIPPEKIVPFLLTDTALKDNVVVTVKQIPAKYFN